MFLKTRIASYGVTSVIAISLTILASPASAQSYSVVRLVSDTAAGGGAKIDPNLVNPWGLSAFPGAPWWVSDNGTGLTTLYDGTGVIESLVVTIPPSASAPAGSIGNPTGTIANATPDFGGAIFAFDSEDGTISTWTGAPNTNIVVDKGSAAVYKGLAQGQLGSVNVLYAANFRAATVEVYDTNFNPVALAPGAFKDARVPAGYAPFNVQAINGNIWVAFAKQDADKKDEVDGPGLGYVDEFDSSGNLLLRLQHGDFLNAPWGIALAPSNFGTFSNNVLVGNFASGTILAFDAATGKIKGVLTGSNGKPVAVRGLWAISFGLGGSTGPTNWLYFTAGIRKEAHGAFGYVVAQ